MGQIAEQESMLERIERGMTTVQDAHQLRLILASAIKCARDAVSDKDPDHKALVTLAEIMCQLLDTVYGP